MGSVGANLHLNDDNNNAQSNLPHVTVKKDPTCLYYGYYENIIRKLTTRKNIEKVEASPSGADAASQQEDEYSSSRRVSQNQLRDSSLITSNALGLLIKPRLSPLKLQPETLIQQLDKSRNRNLYSVEKVQLVHLTLGDCDCNYNIKKLQKESNSVTCLPGGGNNIGFHNGFGFVGEFCGHLNRYLSNITHALFDKFTVLAAGDTIKDNIVSVNTLNSNENLQFINSNILGKVLNNDTNSVPVPVSFVFADEKGQSGSQSNKLIPEKSSSSDTIQNGPIMKEDRAVEVILKSLVSGGVAGMCAKTAVAPLDRMKILLQAHSKHYSHLGVFSGLKGIVEKERFIALYKGNGAQMVRIFPYAATQFTSFEMYKKLFGENSHIGRFAAGSAAGVTAVALTYPLDTIRARLAFQVSGEHIYNGIYQCASHIFNKEGGVRALYRGFTPTICGMIPYAGLSFYCFESFKYLCMKYSPGLTCKRHSKNTGGLVLLLPYKLLCGGVAGAAAQTVSYPLDVTRRRMQLAMMDERTKKFGMGMVTTLKMIYEENGVIRGLYRGMSINYLRAIPMVAVSFSTYEMVKQMLNLDTGLQIKTG